MRYKPTWWQAGTYPEMPWLNEEYFEWIDLLEFGRGEPEYVYYARTRRWLWPVGDTWGACR